MMDMFKNFKTFGKSKSRDENNNQSSASAQSHGTRNPPHTTATQPPRTVSAVVQAHPPSDQPQTTSTLPSTTPSPLTLEQAHRDARRLEIDAQRLVSSLTTAIQLSAVESSRPLSLVEHNTIAPIISEATEPSRLLSLSEHNTLVPISSVATAPSTSPPTGRREKVLDEKNQLILELAEDRDGWKNTAEESFKREDSWAARAEKWQDAARERDEKLNALEKEGEVWCKKMIEVEREVVRLRARATEDSERIKELSQGGLDEEREEDGCREKAEKAKREVKEVTKEAREWKKSMQDAEDKLKTLERYEADLKKREDELAKEELKLKKREDEMVKKLKDSQEEVKALKDAAEVKVQADIKKQNTIASIKKDIIKALNRNDITSAKQSLGKM